MTVRYTVQETAKQAADFVVKKHGKWDHEEWEQLCSSITASGVNLDDEAKQRLGLLLETLKMMYFSLPKRIKSKAKGKAKAKPKAKAKTKAKAKARSSETPASAPAADA